MLTRRDAAAEVNDRPYNNLLRRLNRADFALIEPYLGTAKCGPNDLLYNPGQDVETVHFPCGPSLVSYIVPNEDGRDVETILIGREGAVGGIVSHGYLPAYTRICVKFAGPFVRLPISKLEAAKAILKISDTGMLTIEELIDRNSFPWNVILFQIKNVA